MASSIIPVSKDVDFFGEKRLPSGALDLLDADLSHEEVAQLLDEQLEGSLLKKMELARSMLSVARGGYRRAGILDDLEMKDQFKPFKEWLDDSREAIRSEIYPVRPPITSAAFCILEPGEKREIDPVIELLEEIQDIFSPGQPKEKVLAWLDSRGVESSKRVMWEDEILVACWCICGVLDGRFASLMAGFHHYNLTDSGVAIKLKMGQRGGPAGDEGVFPNWTRQMYRRIDSICQAVGLERGDIYRR